MTTSSRRKFSMKHFVKWMRSNKIVASAIAIVVFLGGPIAIYTFFWGTPHEQASKRFAATWTMGPQQERITITPEDQFEQTPYYVIMLENIGQTEATVESITVLSHGRDYGQNVCLPDERRVLTKDNLLALVLSETSSDPITADGEYISPAIFVGDELEIGLANGEVERVRPRDSYDLDRFDAYSEQIEKLYDWCSR